MLQIIYTTTFKRDIKKIQKRRKDMTKFHLLLSLLINEKNLPQKYHNHKLSGNYDDFGSVILNQIGYQSIEKIKNTLN